MTNRPGRRSLVLFVVVTLALPQSALALREIQTKDSRLEERGLAAALAPATGMEEGTTNRSAILFGLDAIWNRIELERRRGDPDGYYERAFATVFPQAAPALIRRWIKRRNPETFQRILVLLKRLYLETGEDVLLIGVLNSLNRAKIPDELLERFLKGIRLLNQQDSPLISKEEYQEVQDRFNFFLAPYYRSRDPRHKGDPFSLRMSSQSKGPLAVEEIYPLVGESLRRVKGKLPEIDLLVLAPTTSSGENRILPLAKRISEEWKVPLDPFALSGIRRREIPQREVEKLVERLRNTVGLFEGDPEKLRGKTVVVLEDNETSGLTIVALRAAAIEAGARKVFVVSLGKTQPELKTQGSEQGGLEEQVPVWLKPALGADWRKVVYGVHEMAQVTDKIAVLLQPELLRVAGDDGETQVALMSMEGNLHGAFGWPDETKLRLGLLTPQSVEAFKGEGYRVIRVVRHPESEQTPLPWEAIPLVVAEALAGGRPTFWVNVTPYLNLKGITLPEILSTLSDLFA